MYNQNKKLSALICDDDPQFTKIFSELLEKMNLFDSIITAKDGMDALCKLDNQKFDILIIDENMPKKNGLEVIKHLVNSNNFDPQQIILCSGELTKFNINRALKLKCNKIVPKPIDGQILVKQIKSVISYINKNNKRKHA